LETNKKNNNYLVQGTILVIASFVARAIGMIYRIPLTRILGAQGNAYYSTANEIYAIILMISSFSLPLAVSKLVSERLHKGERQNAQRVFACAMKFGLVVGGIMSVLTFALSGVITKFMNFEMAAYALRVLSPAIFIYAMVGVLRGYFQGHETMVPTAVSQVVEQIVNAVVSVGGAAILVGYGTKLGETQGNDSLGPAWGAAGGTLGTVVSVSVSLVFLLFVYFSYLKTARRKTRSNHGAKRESERDIYRALIYTILPVILSTVIYNISTVIDQGIFGGIMAGQGYLEKEYSTVWGIFVEFKVLMNVPLSIASCLAPSVVPSLTASMMEEDYRAAGIKVRDSIRYTMVFTIPCAVGLAALASPVMRLVYGDSSALAAGIMQSGALMIVLYALSTLTTGILQGLGEMQKPLIHSAIALVLHILALIMMLKFTGLNIYSVVYANIFFALIVCLLNAWAIYRTIGYRQELRRTFIIPVFVSGIMGLAAYGTYRLFSLFAGLLISTVMAILVGVVVYAVLLVRLRGITERELMGMPKGHLLVALLKKCRIL
jgi:stage V sporulation protein B